MSSYHYSDVVIAEATEKCLSYTPPLSLSVSLSHSKCVLAICDQTNDCLQTTATASYKCPCPHYRWVITDSGS